MKIKNSLMKIKRISIYRLMNLIAYFYMLISDYEITRCRFLLEEFNDILETYRKIHINHFGQILRTDIAVVITKDTNYDKVFHVPHTFTLITAENGQLKYENLNLDILNDKFLFLTDPTQIILTKLQKSYSFRFSYNENALSDFYFVEKVNLISKFEEKVIEYFKDRLLFFDLCDSVLKFCQFLPLSHFFKILKISYLKWIEIFYNQQFTDLGLKIQLTSSSITIHSNLLNFDRSIISNTVFWKIDGESKDLLFFLQFQLYELTKTNEYFITMEKFTEMAMNYLLEKGIMKKSINLDEYPEIITMIFPYTLNFTFKKYIPVTVGMDFFKIKKFSHFDEYFERERIDRLRKDLGSFYFTLFSFEK